MVRPKIKKCHLVRNPKNHEKNHKIFDVWYLMNRTSGKVSENSSDLEVSRAVDI